MKEREKFSSRLGFILISAGCAIGIGNVWRFPYITGQYGGAAFVLIYLLFLVILGLPIMVMEFAVGRASRKSAARSFHLLEPKGTKWHLYSYGAMLGNYMLMMFYTTVGGWMLAYFFKIASGTFTGLDTEAVGNVFNTMLSNPGEMTFWMVIVTAFGFGTCCMGLQKGVERITKVMMVCLLTIMVVLCVKSCTLPGAIEGIKFYLLPDFGRLKENGLLSGIYAAMGQAFFSLSITGSGMIVYGSYLSKKEDIPRASMQTAFFDTIAAMLSALAIMPAVFAFGIEPSAGPSLMFVTIPNIFKQMPMGRLFAVIFFLSVCFAGITSLINMFEAVIESWQHKFKLKRNHAVLLCGALTLIVGLFMEEEARVGTWMDFITIIVVPFGAVLGAISIYYILGFDKIKEELEEGRKKGLSKIFKSTAKYIYVPLTIIVFILGLVYKGIG